ncbi:hypothetical protein JCM10207_003812 [Rhodosporidiobolus poonsookiae]
MAARLTLAQQLAQIQQPAPQDLDPEDAYATFAHERSKRAEDEAAGRADYLAVGDSKLRKRGEAQLDAKYGGTKGSRKALFDADGSEAGSDAEDDDDDDDDEDGDSEMDGMDDELVGLMNGGEGEDDDDDEGDFEDLEAADGFAASVATDDDASSAEEDSQEEDGPAAPAPASAKGQKGKTARDGLGSMVKQLRQAASADVEKGRDVKKQLAFSDALLTARIALQPAVAASSSLPTPASAPPAQEWFAVEDEGVRGEVESLWGAVVGLGEELFELRTALMHTNESLAPPTPDFGTSRKRARAALDEDDVVDDSTGERAQEARSTWVGEMMSDLRGLEASLDPFLRTTLSKWSDKVLAASGLALKSSSGDKKFKAVQQNALAQVDHALDASTGERERLVKRTRVRRAQDGPGARVLGRETVVGLEGEEGRREVDEECFDDGDFYAQVLRDVVESRMLDLDDATLTSLRSATALARGKKVKKVVDTRASKGRKIRYHVHEKAQNFMIPVEAGHWHDEQTDELFASLLGRSFAPSGNGGAGAGGAGRLDALDPALDDVQAAEGEIELGAGGFRLFG